MIKETKILTNLKRYYVKKFPESLSRRYYFLLPFWVRSQYRALRSFLYGDLPPTPVHLVYDDYPVHGS